MENVTVISKSACADQFSKSISDDVLRFVSRRLNKQSITPWFGSWFGMQQRYARNNPLKLLEVWVLEKVIQPGILRLLL